MLSTKPGKESYVEPVKHKDGIGYDFFVRANGKPRLEETVNRGGGVCLMSEGPIDFKHIRAEAMAGRMGARLMAVVAEGSRGRIYLSPTAAHEETARSAVLVDYPTDWDPRSDHRLPVWEVLHQLIRVFNTAGETGAGSVFTAVQSKVEAARQLAYRLYTLCERTSRAEDARAYNELITSWTGIESAAAKEPALKQGELF